MRRIEPAFSSVESSPLGETPADGATHYGYEPGAIHEILSECGLRIFDADGNGPYSRAGLRETVLSGRMWFYFA